MRKIIGLIVFGVLLAGCGSNQSESKFQGVREKKDYVASGMQYLKNSDIPKAIQSFDLAIKQDPRNLNNYMILGNVYLRLKEYVRAVDTFSGAVIVDPSNGDAYYFLAISKRLKSNVEKTLKAAQDSRAEAVKAAQRSVEIFMQNRDEVKFKRSVAFLKSLEEEQSKNMPNASAAAALPARLP